MRLIVTRLVATLAVLLAASTADAFRVDMAAFLNGSPYAGEALQVNDQIEIRVDLDTEDGSGITLLGVGVLFDEGSFTYRQDLSSTTTYLLYTGTKSPYLIPASTCGGTSGTGCSLFGTRSNQVQLDFISNSLPDGVPGTTATDTSVAGAPQLVSLIFEVTDTTAGSASFDFDFDPFFGSILQICSPNPCPPNPTANPPLTLGSSAVVTLPEPGIAVLSLSALGTVAILRRRRRTA